MLFLTSIALALPLCATAFPWPKEHETEQDVEQRSINCNGTAATPFDPSCWETLDIGDWLKNWNQTVARCGPDDDGSQCCNPTTAPNEPWSKCFLRLATANAGYDCTTIKINDCGLESVPLSKNVNASSMAQMRYVVWNIYTINSFFTNWYTAANNAAADAANIISAVVHLIDPPTQTNMVLSDVLTALTVGLALLGLPEVTGAIQGAQIAAEAKTAANVLNTAIQNAPGVAKAIWPAGTADSQTFQIGQLGANLQSIDTGISNTLESGLEMIMSDVPSFTGFASSGSFSGSSYPSLPNDTAGLQIGFQTYLVTSAMANNKWLAFSGPGYTGNGPAGPFNSSAASQAANFGCTLESSGVCDITSTPIFGENELFQPAGWSEWTSPVTSRSYYANQAAHKNSPTSAALANALATNGWTTLEMVMDGGWNCTQAGNPQGSPVVKVSDQGALDFSCLSQLSVKGGCKNQATWATQGKGSGCCDFFNTC